MIPTRLTVLLIEDDDLDAEAVRRAFKKHGFDADLERASDGAMGFKMARKLVDDQSHSSLIVLLDLNMPGINGHELLELIRKDQQLKPTLVFVLTTSSHDRDVTLAYQQNVAGYFTKERITELITVLKSFRDGAILPRVG